MGAEDEDKDKMDKDGRLPEVIGGAGRSRTRGGGISGVLINTDRPAGTTEKGKQTEVRIL